jgi:succinate dehydrogenase/fumarate reductase cytochrome b subunit (b558 family)
LSGVVPIGAFLLLHIWTTLSVVGSRDLYDRQVGFLHGGPLMGFLEVALVLAPLAFHGAYGVYRSFQPKEETSTFDSPLMVTLQRVSGIIILVFVIAHIYEFRAQTWSRGMDVASYSTVMVNDLSSTQGGVPLIALGYLVGIAASFFHLTNGLSSFVSGRGFTTTPEARARVRTLFRFGGAVFFVLSSGLVLQVATGARFFPAQSTALPCGTAVPPAPPLPSASH